MAETKTEPKEEKTTAPVVAPNRVALGVISARIAHVEESGMMTPKMRAQFDRMTANAMKGNK